MAKELHKEDVVNVNYAMGKFRIGADRGQLLVKRKSEITKEDWTDKPKQKKMLPKFMYQPDGTNLWRKDFDEWLTRSDVAEYLKTDYSSPEVDKFIFDNKIDENKESLQKLQRGYETLDTIISSLSANDDKTRASQHKLNEEILKLSERVLKIEQTHNKYDWVNLVVSVVIFVGLLINLFINK